MVDAVDRRGLRVYTFDELLQRAGINRVELARRLRIKPGSISRWQSSPPGYATAYLELLIECNRWRP